MHGNGKLLINIPVRHIMTTLSSSESESGQTDDQIGKKCSIHSKNFFKLIGHHT